MAASEQNGQLATTLRDHAAYLAWSGALHDRLRAALVYPLLLLAAGGAVILFLLASAHSAHSALSIGLALLLPALAGVVGRWPAARAALKQVLLGHFA